MRIAIFKQAKLHTNTIPILLSLIITNCMGAISESSSFNEERAFDDLQSQTGFGARVPGSTAHVQAIEYIAREMDTAGWLVVYQIFKFDEFELTNIIAQSSNSSDASKYILLGAHYDSRIKSDSDPHIENHATPVPGANDGASGVAVLLELARTFPLDSKECIRFAFFDAEDNGNIDNWNWIMGSRYFVSNLTVYPSAVIILDMVGDRDLGIYKEENSDPALTEEIWQTAHSLGYDKFFIDSYRYRILDDHIPFLEVGIPAVDIIDLDYPYWHTVQDTPDKTSQKSLRITGETVSAWLEKACQGLGY